jgi:hypothetical protein
MRIYAVGVQMQEREDGSVGQRENIGGDEEVDVPCTFEVRGRQAVEAVARMPRRAAVGLGILEDGDADR